MTNKRQPISPTSPSTLPLRGRVPSSNHLVSIETQREFDLLSGQWEERVFVKMYVAARTSGLLAEISDRDWKTLCTLATYMDPDGYCYPSQAELARAMGCSRQMANERVQSLAAFRFHDQPVLLVVKGERSDQGQWARNGYRVLPIASLGIFDDLGGDGQVNSEPGQGERTVSSFLDTVKEPPTVSSTVSSPTVTVPLDTNKIQISNNIERENSKFRRVSPANLSENSPARSEASGPTNGFKAVGEVLPQTQLPSHPSEDADEARQVILEYVADFAAELGDEAKLSASVSRAYHLFQRSGRELGGFTSALYEARSKTKEYTANIKKRQQDPNGENRFGRKNKMPYFFGVLEGILGLREPKTDDTKGDAKQRPERRRSISDSPRAGKVPGARNLT